MKIETKKGIAIGLIAALGASGIVYHIHVNNTKQSGINNDDLNKADLSSEGFVSTNYDFLKHVNKDAVVTINGEKLMFTYKEAEAWNIKLNKWKNREILNIFGMNYELNQDSIEDAYQSALKKLMLYNILSPVPANLSIFINDADSRTFMKNYETVNTLYNSTVTVSKKESTTAATEFVGRLKKDFIDNTGIPYDSINGGVAHTVLVAFKDPRQVQWRNTKLLPTDMEAVLTNIEGNLCGGAENAVRDLVNALTAVQMYAAVSNNNNDTSDKTSYEALVEAKIAQLTEEGAYPLSTMNSIDAKLATVLNGSTIPADSKTANKVISNTNKKAGGTKKTISNNKTVASSEKGVTKDQLLKDVTKDAPELVDSAKAQIDKINKDLAAKTKESPEYIRGLNYNWESTYKDLRDKAVQRNIPLPAKLLELNDNSYEAGRIHSYNMMLDNLLLDVDRIKAGMYLEDEHIKNEKPSVKYDYTTPTPATTPSYTPTTPAVAPSQNTDVEVQEDIHIDTPVDGNVYDENGHVIKKNTSSLSMQDVKTMAVNQLNYVKSKLLSLNGSSKVYRG